MYTNKMTSAFAENQMMGISGSATAGIRNTPANAKNATPTTGSVKRSSGRAGLMAWRKQSIPAPAITSDGRKLEPYCAGNGGCQPPRNSSVATQEIVTMLQYSAMKNAANFMLPYSVWKPATSSFSASGRSKGTRLVSAKAAMMKRMKLMMLKGKIWKMVHLGRKPKKKPAWPSTMPRKLSVFNTSSGAAIASAMGNS